MKRLAFIALSLVLSGCNSDKKDDANSKKPEPPNPAGKWENRSNPGSPYLYLRYEFKDDHSFVRESGTSAGIVTQKVSGSWSTSGQEAPHYPGNSLTETMLRDAGIQPKSDRVLGSIILKYNVKSKSQIEVGATLVAERGPALDLEKRTYDLEEHLSLALDKGNGKEWLSVGSRRFERQNP